MEATPLRELYHVLGMCSTATQQAICEDLLRVRRSNAGKDKGQKLADLFSDALKRRQRFSARDSGFLPANRHNTEGRNPVTKVLETMKQVEVRLSSKDVYRFEYINREIPHLRTEDPLEESCRSWIDCVGVSEARRPVVCEIKWKSDKNAFYGFIQLLTYLSELATTSQIARSLQQKLFGSWDGKDKAHDIVILLVNAKLSGKKGALKDSTCKLAEAFSHCLQNPGCEQASAIVGNIACFSATVHEKRHSFEVHKEWWIPR